MRTPSAYSSSGAPGACRVTTVTSCPAAASEVASACTCRPSPPTTTGGYSQDSIRTRVRPRPASRSTSAFVAWPGPLDVDPVAHAQSGTAPRVPARRPGLIDQSAGSRLTRKQVSFPRCNAQPILPSNAQQSRRPTTPGTGTRWRACGGCPSAVSLTEPRPHSARCASIPRIARASSRRESLPARVDVAGRAATATPCPGGRRGPARPGRRGARPVAGRVGREGAQARAGSAARPRPPRAPRGSGASGACGSDQASSWLGRSVGVVAGRAVDDVVAGRRRVGSGKRRGEAGDGARSRTRRRPAPGRAPTARDSVAIAAEPVDPQRVDLHRLAGRAASPARRRRGRPSRSAPRPSAPWVSSPSAGSTRMPYRVPAQVARRPPSAARAAARRPGRCRRSRVTCRSTACRNHSVASTVLYSVRPVSAVLASMPSDSVAAYAAQQLAALVGAAGGQEQPLVARSSCPATRRRTTGSRPPRPARRRRATTNASAARASVGVDGVGRPAPRPRPRAAARRAAATTLGGRRAAARRGRRPTPRPPAPSPGAQLGGEPPGVPQVLGGGEPALRLLAVVHAAPPAAGRLPAGPAQPVRVLDHAPPSAAGPPAPARRRARSPCASRQVHSASRASSTGAAGDQPVHDRRRTARRARIASSRSSTTSPTRQRQRGRPSTRSKRSSSCGRAGSTAPPAHSWVPSRTGAPDGRSAPGRARPGRRAGAAGVSPGDHQQRRGSGGCAGRTPCPSRSRRGRRAPATPGGARVEVAADLRAEARSRSR